jgi:hypothetical protein
MQTVSKLIPFKDGDGHYHQVYEVQLENYTGDIVSADQLNVLDALDAQKHTACSRASTDHDLKRQHGHCNGGPSFSGGPDVITVVDGLPNSPIGSFPARLPTEQADGNHVVLDLGEGHYVLYAHFAPYGVLVHEGQFVHRGQVLGKVGTSGNSSEPHLHFQVTDGPSTFLSSGVPYLLPKFTATHAGASTKAFDQAIIDGKPIATVALPGPPYPRICPAPRTTYL